MKAINKVCQILAVVSGAAALVLFFTNFAVITAGGKEVLATGAQLGFGSTINTTAFGDVNMARSADILLCLILTAATLLFASLSFKFKGSRYASPAFAIFTGIYMLVISLKAPVYFVDTRPLAGVTAISYGASVWIATIVLFVTAAFGIAHLLLDDRIMVAESKGAKLTIPKRFVRFLKDYKSEVKKIVWPGPRAVFKNTLVVLSMCLLIGAFIWLLDYGLGQLLTLILGK